MRIVVKTPKNNYSKIQHNDVEVKFASSYIILNKRTLYTSKY